MHTFIVQYRSAKDRRLHVVGEFRAKDSTRAIIQAAKVLAEDDLAAIELVATPND